MEEKPLVSIIIVNYNGKRFLNECLSSVFRTQYPNFEIVFVDNASSDNSLDFVSRAFKADKRLNIVKNSQNLGYGPANNAGFKHARGSYIVFLNNDTSVEPEWLATLVDAMEKDPAIGLAQSLILNMDGHTVQTAGMMFSDYLVLLHSIGAGECCCDIFPDVFEVSFAIGASMIARRDFLKEIDLFDPKYARHYDDEYLSFRAWLIGKRVVTVSRSKVRHFGEGTSRHAHNIAIEHRHFTIAIISLVFDTYWNLMNLTKALSILAVHNIYNSLRELLNSRQATRFWGNISAVRWTIENFRYIWGNRLKYWSKARIDKKSLITRMIKIRIPTSIYLVLKLLTLYFKSETEKYRKSLMSMYQQEQASLTG